MEKKRGKKESFYWLTKTIAHDKAEKSENKFAMLKKFIRSKLRALQVLALFLALEYFGNRTLCLCRSRFHLSSVGPCKNSF